jgi:S-DNA-T family DNA segregation ATPase FtsK/SpoIIIE
MPNPEWRVICARGRALREAAGTLTGHAAGDDTTRAIDPSAVVKVLGAGDAADDAAELPEPLASVVEYLGEGIDEREFVPTAELIEALDVEPGGFARQMGELRCRPIRQYVPTEDGGTRRVRGYLTADIRTAIDDFGSDDVTGRDEP